jgi:hypothetical protein
MEAIEAIEAIDRPIANSADLDPAPPAGNHLFAGCTDPVDELPTARARPQAAF